MYLGVCLDMYRKCRGCGKEFRPATPFIEFCSECLKKGNYKEEDKRAFEDSFQEMCDYCAEIEEANNRKEEYNEFK